MSAEIMIPRRFNGPPDSANGGFACGAMAHSIEGSAEVTLRKPPPLDRPLEVSSQGEKVMVHDEGTLIAEARLRPRALDRAQAAARRVETDS